MPNIGAVLKQEIARLSRKEVRGQVTTTKKASAQYRRDIAALKRQVAALAKQVTMLARRPVATSQAAGLADDGQRSRFSAKGLKSHRAKLGLSAGDYGKLVGVSAQSVYNWEAGKASPRAGQRAQLAALRSLGKREAQARLGASAPTPARKAAKSTGRRRPRKARKVRKSKR